ncbi:hypothetical protein EC968_002989 [Mortierella alpina]|nr:hypothetical protein EC968_002989 [Mortierella alpina]
MALGRTILRNYRGTAKESGSLEQLATMLGAGRINRIFCDNPEYHATDEFLRHVYSATVLRLWDVSVTVEETQELLGCMDDSAFNNSITAKVGWIIDNNINDADIEDPSSANAALFLRDMTLYMELSSAIKVGDIGRLESALRWLTVVFHAGSNSNYAYELLHLRCCSVHLWDQDTKDAVLASMLVNKSGGPQGWKPTDLYQEHCNRTIKHVYHSLRGDTTFDMLRDRISMNIDTLDNIKDRTDEAFKAPRNKRKHAAVDAENEIVRISTILEENGILGCDPESRAKQDSTVQRARNMFKEGFIALQDKKRIDAFMDKHSAGSLWMGSGPEDDVAPEADTNIEEE